jgi:diguanylate cyclase (GGDEF)-like protein
VVGRADHDADRLITGFRWALVAGGLAFLAVTGDPVGLGLAAGNTAVNLLARLSGPGPGRARARFVHVAQLAADLALAVWLVAGVRPTGPDDPVWALLLLPVVEGAVRFQMRGALTTLVVGLGGVWAVGGVALGGSSLVHQVAAVAVAVAVGLVAQQLDLRLQQLARSRAETDRRANLLSVVAAAARAVTQLEPGRVLQAVTESALDLGFDMAEIYLAEPADRRLVPVVQRGWPDHHPPAGQPWDQGCAGRAYATGRTVVVDDYQMWEHALDIHRRTGIARSAAAVPVVVDGGIQAVLTVATRTPRGLTGYERECLELLAVQAGVALRNAHVHAERESQQAALEHQATHDPLTGLANRAHFLARLAERLATPPVERFPAVVLFLDLDGFKQVNDRLGHAVGDELLVAVADRLRDTLRPEDVIARHGGDEFTVLLAREVADPMPIADRLLLALGQPSQVGAEWLATGASIGIAVERPGDTVDALLRRADAAMYRAKTAGRGCASR